MYKCVLRPAALPAGAGGGGGRLAQHLHLVPGRTVVGRHDVDADRDRMISRKQLICEWDAGAGRLLAWSGRGDGKATSYRVRRPAPPAPLPLWPGGAGAAPCTGMELGDGDVVTLDVQHCPVVVGIEHLAKGHSEAAAPGELGGALQAGMPMRYVNQGKAVAAKGPPLVALHRLVADGRTEYAARAAAGAAEAASDDPRIFYNDGTFMFTYDAFPKGTVHLLGFLLHNPVAKVGDLGAGDLADVRGLHAAADRVVAHLLRSHPPLEGQVFQIGYHATPSLLPLHLHVMTTDYAAPALKNKKHYHSFIPPHFVTAAEIEARLAATGRVQLAGYETSPVAGLACRWCHAALPNMPQLKTHLAQCARNPNPGVARLS
eukprot:TRINITY_DN25093_c0_g1_i1.p1 TRINITY_DN25093_c0_g1~~TRINITY_DN25093_c0_g1_i1.p1  ORF type:complete len:374 (+),score=102.73 TRINITY_DN25093_c0_g1_i1:2-1123(+)